jgi:hypothetical protein
MNKYDEEDHWAFELKRLDNEESNFIKKIELSMQDNNLNEAFGIALLS